MSALKRYLLTVDIFEPLPASDEREDEQQRSWNIMATRFYFLTLMLILFALAVISWSNTQVTIVSVRNPSKDYFEQIPIDAQCPCSHGSVSYGDFTSLQPVFHQVCSSDFVSDRWIEAIFSGSNSTYYYLGDFRTFGSAQFQAIAGLCRLSIANIQQSIASFKQTTLISLNALSDTFLRQQTKAAIVQFNSIAPQAFGAQLNLVLRTSKANKLASGLQTNIYFDFLILNTNFTTILTGSQSYMADANTECLCETSPYCKADAVFDSTFGAPTQNDFGNYTTVPGISSGCLPVSSILQSTLECFYNQTCLNWLLSFYPTAETFPALTASNQSLFYPKSTVQSMVDQLMVDSWSIDISYDKYYAQCAPAKCTYSKVEHRGFLFALTKVISLLASLAIVLKFMMSTLHDFIRSRRNPPEPSPPITGK